MPNDLLDDIFRPGAFAGLQRQSITGRDGSPYITRVFLNKNADGSQVYLHYIHRDDEDEAPHDHPFAFRSLIVSGSYLEAVPVMESPSVTAALGHKHQRIRAWDTKVFRPGDWNNKQPTDLHRLEVIEGPVITLVYRGPKVRSWGFYTPNDGWKPHREYLTKKFGTDDYEVVDGDQED